MTFPLFAEARMPRQHSLARLRGLPKPDKDLQGTVEAQCSVEGSCRMRNWWVWCSISLGRSNPAQLHSAQREGKAPRAWKGWIHTVSVMLKCKQFPHARPEACRRTTIGSRRGSFGANIFWLGVRTPTMYDLFFFPFSCKSSLATQDQAALHLNDLAVLQ